MKWQPVWMKAAFFCKREVEMDAENESFVSSYDKLMKAMNELFFENWEALKKGDIKPVAQVGAGTYHTSKDLNAIRLKSNFAWDENIAQVLDRIKNDRN